MSQPTDKRVQFRIDDSGVSERLRSLREAVGVQRADFRPRRSRVVDEDIAANELEERANEKGYLEVKGSPTFAYIRDHTEKKMSEWGGPNGMKKLHFMFCETLVGMKEQGRFERFRATNTTSDKYEVDVGADRVSSHGSGVQEEVRLYPCRNCLRKADYQGYSSASNEERTKIVHDFNAQEAMDVLWQRFDLFRQEMAGVKSAHSPTGYPPNWSQTSRAFRQLNGWRCSKCGVYLGDADTQELLHVHHVDGDKRNNNLMCLCKECHSKEPNHHRVVLSEEELRTISRARERDEREPNREGSREQPNGDLEHRLHGRVAGLMRRVLEVRRARIIQAPTQGPTSGFLNEVESALEDGRITEGQEWRIDQTDFIIRAQRRADCVPVWVAIEASFTVRRKDVIRARASADALRAVFGAETLAVVAGYGIDAANAAQAEAAGVAYLQVPRPGQE